MKMYDWLDQLQQGVKYALTVVEESKELIGEYRGYEAGGEWEGFIIFWEEGASAGSLIYLGDIENVKAA